MTIDLGDAVEQEVLQRYDALIPFRSRGDAEVLALAKARGYIVESDDQAVRSAALVVKILQGRTTISEASRQYDLPPSEIESWTDQARAGMEWSCAREKWEAPQETPDQTRAFLKGIILLASATRP